MLQREHWSVPCLRNPAFLPDLWPGTLRWHRPRTRMVRMPQAPRYAITWTAAHAVSAATRSGSLRREQSASSRLPAFS